MLNTHIESINNKFNTIEKYIQSYDEMIQYLKEDNELTRNGTEDRSRDDTTEPKTDGKIVIPKTVPLPIITKEAIE